MFLHSVAPKELIQADFDLLKSYEHLETTPEIEELLFMQSLEGRSHNGAGVFENRSFVNTTIDDVVRALGHDPEKIKARRQAIIDDISHFAEDAMNGEKRDRLVNESGEPIMGLPFFRDRKVNPRDVLRGLYLGGLRDNIDIRKETEKARHVKIGGGRCYIIDVKTMLEMNLDGEKLAEEAHEDRIDDYTRRGLIVSTEGVPDPKTQRYFYIRHRIGPGQSDDAAFIMAGVMYNADVALGVFLADAIDTLEKYAPVFRDQDCNLAFQIARGFGSLQVTNEDVYDLVAMSAIPEAEEHMIPDSSLRYLLSIDARSSSFALQNHLDFVEGKPVVALPVSFKRILSTQFYEYINRRLLNEKKLEKFAIPNLSLKELDKHVMDFAKKDFAVLAKDATIAEAVRKFKESKAEILLLIDKNGKVAGTVRPSDLLPYLRPGDNGA
jgi:hypothetical protein